MPGTLDNSTLAITKALERIRQLRLNWELCKGDQPEDGVYIRGMSQAGIQVCILVTDHYCNPRQGFLDNIFNGARYARWGRSASVEVSGSGVAVYGCWISDSQLPKEAPAFLKERIAMNRNGFEMILSFFDETVEFLRSDDRLREQLKEKQVQEKFWNG